MELRDLPTNPIVFLVLAAITVLSSGFAVWTYWRDRPSREISYLLETKEIINLDKLGPTELTIEGQTIKQGSVYLNQLFA